MEQNLIAPEMLVKINEMRQFCDDNSTDIKIVIKNDLQMQHNGEMLKSFKQIKKEIDLIYHDIKDPITKKGREVDAYFRQHLDFIDLRTKALDRSIVEYRAELQRIEDEKQAKENARIELLRRAEAEKIADALAKAQELSDAGKLDQADRQVLKAEIAQDKIENLVPKTVAQDIPKIAGVSIQSRWSGAVTDINELIKFCANTPMFANLLTPDQAAINRMATMYKGEQNIPGIRWVLTQSTVTRR